jgi:hypothetical protein
VNNIGTKHLTGLAILALLLAGCATMGSNSSGVDTLVSGNHSNMKDQQYNDIHNQADFDALWQKAFANQASAPAKPTVDFSSRMVLAAFLGEQKHGGYLMRIQDIDASGDSVNVTLEVTVPGQNCRFLQSETEPFLFVSAPASSKTVNFNVRQTNAPACG